MKHIAFAILTFLVAQTSQASLVIVNGLSHEHTVQVGSKVQGSIVIKNTAKTVKRARIYKSFVEHDCNGQTSFSLDSDHPRSNVGWILLSDNEVIIPASQSYTLTYEIEPTNVSDETGSYWGVVMIEEIKDLDTLTPQRGVTVTSLIRYAVQIITNFEKDAVKNLEISGVNIDTSRDTRTLSVSVDNTGNYMLKPILVLELYDANGEQVFRNEIPYQKVYPGLCKLFEVPLDDVAEGTYTGILVADCGDENIFGLNLELEVPAAN